MSFTDHVINVHGAVQHYYRSGGAKPPLVMLHGFTDDGTCWFPIAAQFTADYDVILPDARGHGATGRIAGRGIEDTLLAEDLGHLLSALKLDRPALLGHSMGGLTALILAATQPERVGCLLLEDPPLFPPFTAEERAQREDAMRQWSASLRRMQQMSLEALAADEQGRSPRWSVDELRWWAASKHRLDLDVFAMPAQRPAWQSLMRQVRCPVLLLYGDTGTLVTPAIAQEAAALWHQGQAVPIAHAGHCIRRDNPADYVQVVQAFLRTHYRP